ncbi:MAG TPA: dethiobiotin synthase, partial [Planctomycetaceae bacterium]|nr:dethiobiotin synthase [Planctomycetaceae bacterium]
MNDGDPRSHCHVFVTGTDTGVGKTVVSAALCRGLALLGRPVRYWKPIQTGVDEEPSDASFVQSFGESHVPVEPSAWVYGAPRAPDQAAALEGREPPEFPVLVTRTRDLLQKEAALDWVIEGAGGLLVPLDDGRNTWRDLLASVPLAPLVVART